MKKQSNLAEVYELINLAKTYAEDGAFHTASARLQTAAQVMAEIAVREDQLIRDLSNKHGEGS